MPNPSVPCPPPVTRPERRAIMTIAVGDDFRWMFDLTIPRIRALAEAWGVDCIVVDDAWRKDEHPCYMKQAINALWWQYDRVLYMDSDILANPEAPNLFDIVPIGKCAAVRVDPQAGQKVNDAYIMEYNKAMQKAGFPTVTVPEKYRNRHYSAGVFLCDKETNPHKPPVGGIMRLPGTTHYDQAYFNLMINAHEIPMHDLPIKWNLSVRTIPKANTATCEELSHRAHFLHFVGNETKRLLQKQKKENLMYKVNIVGDPTGGWILERMARQIINARPEHAAITFTRMPIDEPGVINYYNPYRCYKGKSQDAIDVCFFTHPEVKDTWDRAAQECDHAVAMCAQYAYTLEEVMPGRVSLIYPGVDAQYRRPKLRAFFPSRMDVNAGYRQRKGLEDFLRLCKEGWIECICSNGAMTEAEMLREYERADVIVSTATMEGGPMCVLEALAMRKPVVARAGVGLVDDIRGVLTYEDYDGLRDCLYSMLYARGWGDTDAFTWERYAAAHWALFEQIAEERGLAYEGKAEPKAWGEGRKPVLMGAFMSRYAAGLKPEMIQTWIQLYEIADAEGIVWNAPDGLIDDILCLWRIGAIECKQGGRISLACVLDQTQETEHEPTGAM